MIEDDGLEYDADPWSMEDKTSVSAVRDIQRKMSDELKRLMPDIDELIKSGADAKEFAKKVRSIAQFKQLKDLFSDDERLAQAAAEKILDRSDGKAASEDKGEKAVTVNVMNITSDKDKEDLARRMAFLEELAKRKGIGDATQADTQ